MICIQVAVTDFNVQQLFGQLVINKTLLIARHQVKASLIHKQGFRAAEVTPVELV